MDSRIEVRIEKDLRKRLSLYCKSRELTQSDTVREALEQYLDLGSFKAAFSSLLQNRDFHEALVRLYGKHQAFAEFIETFYGADEENLVMKAPENLLWAVEASLITESGKRAFEKRKGKK